MISLIKKFSVLICIIMMISFAGCSISVDSNEESSATSSTESGASSGSGSSGNTGGSGSAQNPSSTKKIEDNFSITLKTAVGGAWIHLIASWTDADFAVSKADFLVSDEYKPVIDGTIHFTNIIDGECSSLASSTIWGVNFENAGFVSESNHSFIFYMNVNGGLYKITVPFTGKNNTNDEEFELSGDVIFERVGNSSAGSSGSSGNTGDSSSGSAGGSTESGGSAGSGSSGNTGDSGSSSGAGSGGNQESNKSEGIQISGPSTVKVTSQIDLMATSVPEGSSLGTINWSSSDKSVALVSGIGTVTGLKVGTVVIRAESGSLYATKTITVVEDVDPESSITSSSQISPESKYPVPFGIVLNGDVGNGQFSICFGAPNPKADYWNLFITGGDLNDKKVKLNTCGVTNIKVGKAATYSLKLYAVYVEDEVPHYSNYWEGSVNVTTNSVTQNPPSDADDRLANRTLVQKKDTSTLTLQFENNTEKWKNDQIWVTAYGRNSRSEWCYLNKDGTAIPITAGTTSADWSFRFSDVDSTWGLQVKDFSSSRIYFTCGSEPVSMNAVVDANGNIGVAQPNMAIENDANATKYFDWIEFTAGDVLYVNTTQVDAFTFPIVVADYADDGMGGYEWKKSVGITKSRKEVFDAWETWTNTYTHYKNLVRCNGTRILAPCKVPKSDFDMTYMDSYIADVWNYYKTNDLRYSEPEHGTYTGRVYEVQGTDGKTKNVLIMTRESDKAKFYVYDTPNMEEAFEGSGKLAMDCNKAQSKQWFGTEEYGNDETSKNVQNRICSAFTRHAFIKSGDKYINVMDDPKRYYTEEPANMYSAFFHKNAGNLDGYAYGFAYDDNHDQSTTTVDANCRGVIVGIGKWE